jgi:hypothetical protein
VRRQYSEQRATGEVVHVESSPGIVIVVAAWMLDAASCAGMDLGAPRASVTSLAELHQMLLQRGFRRSSSGVHHTHHEEQDDQFTQTTPDTPGTACAHAAALSMAFESPVLQGISESERASAIAQLATLLLQAAGVQQTGADDGEH